MLSFKTIADLKLYSEVIFNIWKYTQKINPSFKNTLILVEILPIFKNISLHPVSLFMEILLSIHF